MAWMVARRECNWSRPNSKFSFNAKPGAPVRRPRDFVDYCVGKGWAEEIRPPNREEAKRHLARR